MSSLGQLIRCGKTGEASPDDDHFARWPTPTPIRVGDSGAGDGVIVSACSSGAGAGHSSPIVMALLARGTSWHLRVGSPSRIVERTEPGRGCVAHSRLAAIHVALGQLPLAAQSIQRAQRDGDWDLGFARGDARWEQVRGMLVGL
jgi:hypothetical protein